MKWLLLTWVLISVLFFAVSACAESYLGCEITPSCSYTEVLYLKNESGGYWNAHAQLVTNGSYPYVICCNTSVGTLSNSSCADVTVLKLSSATNAHVQIGNYTGAGEYSESACLSETSEEGSIQCVYTNSDCGADYECLCSIASSSDSDNNITNAHAGPCGEYLKNVCCRYSDSSPPSITIYSPENKTYFTSPIDLNVAANETTDTWWYSLNGGSNTTFIPNTTITPACGPNNITVYANDSTGNVGSSTVWFTYYSMDMSITKIISPGFVVARENETLGVNITVKINQTSNDIPEINVSDEVPYDFPLPQESGVRVYFFEYSPYQVVEITTNATVNVSILDQAGTSPTLVMVNVSKIYQTDAGSNLTANDYLMITYTIKTDEMEPDEEKTMYTHAWIENNESCAFDREEPSYLRAALVVVRGHKRIWAANLTNPQNLSAKIEMRAIGGKVSELYLSDYLPAGATLWDLNVTYYNSTDDDITELVNVSDYILLGPYEDVLPDGTNVDVYLYNFTIYSYLNWDGSLYDNDSIIITYNVSVIGGGQWVLPTIISGFDPTYKKHITTETFGSANVPLFDVIIKTLTAKVGPGEVVRALLRMINVGGPRATVDVFVTYSAKTIDGGLIVERSETFAVAEQKEKELSLPLPERVEQGIYNFEALVTYTGREAMSTDIFEVVVTGAGVGVGIGETGFLYYILVAVMGVIIGALLVIRRK
jgi:hypothetical protein